MDFKIEYILVGLMQVIGFFVQRTTGFRCTVIASAVTNGLLGTAAGVPCIYINDVEWIGHRGSTSSNWFLFWHGHGVLEENQS